MLTEVGGVLAPGETYSCYHPGPEAGITKKVRDLSILHLLMVQAPNDIPTEPRGETPASSGGADLLLLRTQQI